MADFHKTSSRYISTPVKDFYLDLWDGDEVNFQADEADTEYTIENKYDQRPDLFAHDKYGNARLWWVFAMRNKDQLIDPIGDFTSGKTIWVPDKEAVSRRI